MRAIFPTSLCAAAILAVVGCRSPSIPNDTIVLLVEQKFHNLDPLYATDAVSQKIDNVIHGALVQMQPDMQVAPELALKWDVKGYRDFHFTLKPGLRFHDGSPLTSEDVVRSFEQFKSTGPNGVAFAHVTRISTDGPNAVRFMTDIPQPFLLMDLPAVKIFKRIDGRVIGAGRFEPVSETENELTTRRFAFFPEEVVAGSFNKIVFRYVADDTTRYQLLIRGDANVMISSLSLTKTDSLKKSAPPGMQILDTPGVSYNYLCFNLRDPKLANIKVRRAIAHAINIDEILKYRVRGFGYRATGILAPSHADYYEPDVRGYSFDPALAERLLDEAGYPRKSPGGIRFQLSFKTTLDKSKNDLARIFVNELREIGIEVRLQTVESGTYFADLKARNFQLFESRWIGVTNPSIYFRAFHSSQGSSGLNRGGYSNPKLDALIDKAMVETDDLKRKRYFSEAQKIVAEDLPYVSLWHWNETFIGTRDMRNVIMYPNGNYMTLARLRR